MDRVSKAFMTLVSSKTGNVSSQEFDGEKAVIGVSKEARETAVRNSELEGDQQNSNANSKHAKQTSNTNTLISSTKTSNTGKRLSYKKNKNPNSGSGSSNKNSSGSSRNQSLTPSNEKMDSKHSSNINSKVLSEKRPSITEAELTPIVVTQLHNTKKHKDELRKARRGSQPKQADVAGVGKKLETKNSQDVVSDSGAESCSEEARRKTAEAFMTGIISSIPGAGVDHDQSQSSQPGGQEDIVSEVENVLTKLMASLQRGDATVPGLGVSSNNIIPLITNLQASLKANVQSPQSSPAPQPRPESFQDSQSVQIKPIEEPEISVPKYPSFSSVEKTLQQNSNEQDSTKTANPVATGANSNKTKTSTDNDNISKEKIYEDLDDGRNESKIAWKIRAQRKRQQKHLTLGLTREEFANIQESLKYRPLEVYGVKQQPYSLTRNKSDGQILKQRQTVDPVEKFPLIATRDLLQDSPEELGYVSDVCDYNVQHFGGKDEASSGKQLTDSNASQVVHGMLSLSIASDDRAFKVDKTTVVKNDHVNVRGRKAYSDIEQMDPKTSNIFNVVKPFPGDGKQTQQSEDDPDSISQYSRQSSVEDNSKSDSKSKRKSSGGKSSIKSKIQMRKMMKEANKMERPTGTLSDGDHELDDGNDSVEEKQDSEPIVDDEIRNSNKTLRPQADLIQLTPETERRMKDWNSRFSNLKHSFDPSDREDNPSRSPSTQRHSEATMEVDGSRGRSRFKERGQMGPRSQSAHTNLIGGGSQVKRNPNPHIVIDKVDIPQSKDDKNKNNTIIARRGSSLTEQQKEKSPSVKRFNEDTDDEYVQYMNSVDRYRQNNPNPKPFRPVTARTDAIANPLRKLSDVREPQSVPVRGQVVQQQQQQQSQQQQQLSPQLQAKSKQGTPVRENSMDKSGASARISRSVPKEVIRTTKQTPHKEESQAEILGLVKTNRETGQVEKTKDMDYEDYMNIINRVRITKEQTRVRTEQARLASMYAQELKRQEEIQEEEERLQMEQQKFEEEKRNPKPDIPIIGSVTNLLSQNENKSDTSLEKGQLDNNEQEQLKISPSTSSATVSHKSSPIKNASPQIRNMSSTNNKVGAIGDKTEEKPTLSDEYSASEALAAEERLQEETLQKEKEEEERRLIEAYRNEQIMQQKMREEQVLAEQKKLEKLREEQIKQEKDREEIRRLEIERLKQIKEDQERLEEERRIQEEEIRQEQLRLEEERRKREELQEERQAQYQKQHEEMEAKTKEMEEQKRLESERLMKEEISRQTSMSPREKLIYDRMRYQEMLREEQLKEEAKIRQEKLTLIRQEEMLLTRQEEMLRQIQEEKEKLLKQEEMIRNRQQDRLKQVRSEKALLEKQETMLKLREEQLIQERRRQEKLKEEAQNLRRQEEEIRRRQEEIAKELMQSDMKVQNVDDVMVCQAREGQVFVGRKPHFTETVPNKPQYNESMLDNSVVHVQTLNTSDWDSTSDAESIMNKDIHSGVLKKSFSTVSNKSIGNTYRGANENYDSTSPFVTLSDKVEIIEPEEIVGEEEEGDEQWTGSSEEEDTMEEELYECKVEVKTREANIPTSVRTIESVVDVPGWAPITPYLNVSKSLPASSAEEVSAIFSEGKHGMQYMTAGVVTSPESVMTSTNLITTPDSSISLQSQLSTNEDHELSSWPGSPVNVTQAPKSPVPPSLPPPPRDSKDLMKESFKTVQPDVPPRDDSFGVTAVYSKDEVRKPDKDVQRRSLIEVENSLIIPRSGYAGGVDPAQLSPRLGGPGSAFKPYASSENLYDPTLFGAPKQLHPLTNGLNGNGNGSAAAAADRTKRFSNSSLKPPKIVESEEEFFKPKPSPKSQRSSRIFSTTDTEPEMKEFNLAPIGSDKKTKKFQKPIYSTSETEEEYQSYLKMKPKWYGKGGHKDSWDPMQIASPPQIVQKPVGLVQKPKPQPQVAQKIERGAEVYQASLQIFPGNGNIGQNGSNQSVIFESNNQIPNQNLVPPNFERIQKSDSIIEVREKSSMIPAFERIQKSNSVVEVVPVRKMSAPVQTHHSLDETSVSAFHQPSQQVKKETSPFIHQKSPMKESSPYYPQQQLQLQQVQQQTIIEASQEISGQADESFQQPFPVKELSPYENINGRDKTFSAASTTTAPVSYSTSADNLQVPTTPQDSEDQTTPQAPRKFYVPKQTSVESTNSFSENDEGNEGQFSAVLKAIKEDPETTKKKEMHKSLMNEALKKVEMRNIQKKNFSQLARTNPTLASLNIVTRKELKMEELHEKYEQEDINRNRNKSGSTTKDDSSAVAAAALLGPNSTVNAGVLQTFRELSIHKGQGGQNSASRQAAIAAKKASTPVKPDGPKSQSISKDTVTTSNSDLSTCEPTTPMVVLRKQPRILEAEELKARTSGTTAGIGNVSNTSNATPGIDVVSALPVQESLNNVSSIQETKEKAEQTHIQSETSSNKKSNVDKKPETNNVSNSTTSIKDSNVGKGASADKTFSPERKLLNPEVTPSVKQSKDIVQKTFDQPKAVQKSEVTPPKSKKLDVPQKAIEQNRMIINPEVTPSANQSKDTVQKTLDQPKAVQKSEVTSPSSKKLDIPQKAIEQNRMIIDTNRQQKVEKQKMDITSHLLQKQDKEFGMNNTSENTKQQSFENQKELVPQPVVQKDERAEKALEKIKAAKEKQQKIENQKSPQSVKQNLEGLVHVKPKQQEASTDLEKGLSDNIPKMVRRAAEKFEANLNEMNNKEFSTMLNFSPNIRGRSKSISNRLREQMEDTKVIDPKPQNKTVLPWTGKSPPVIRRKEAMRNNKGYALQMSKSSDSITAAKLLAKARAENCETGNSLRINSNFSKSIQKQLDVYSKTKEEIQEILSLAKIGSVNDRIALFSQQMGYNQKQHQTDPDEKAEAIRREIEEARASHNAEAQETVSDTEIEFQAPIESKVKPLKIPLKPKILNSSAPNNKTNGSPSTGLRINQQNVERRPSVKERRPSIEDLPSVKSKIQNYITAANEESSNIIVVEDKKEPQMTPKPILRKTSVTQEPQLTPILKRREMVKERSRSPKKKTPKPVGDQFLSPEQNFKIYTLSATDLSATEDEAEQSKSIRNRNVLKQQLEEQPTFLQIPPKPVSESRPGIIKSKSFANPGQFECSIEDSAGKKIQMMSFFSSNNNANPKASNNSKAKTTSICDDLDDDDDDDLVDIDAEFESLLTKTFEKESRKLSAGEKATTGSRSQTGNRSSAGPGGRGISLDMSNTGRSVSFDSGPNRKLQKSQSFGFNMSSSNNSGVASSVSVRQAREQQDVSRRDSVVRQTRRDSVRHIRSRSSSPELLDQVNQRSSMNRQKNFDPIAALPTSHNKQYNKNYGGQTPPPHSPSPTQSEYDTCDPWDDY